MRRAPYMGNFTRASGMPPRSMAAEFGSWSLLMQRFYRAYPAFLAIWHCAVLLICPLMLFTTRSRYARAIASVLLGTSALAWIEYLVSCLGDVINTERHLIVFHLFTDATFFLALAMLAALAQPSQSPSSAPLRSEPMP